MDAVTGCPSINLTDRKRHTLLPPGHHRRSAYSLSRGTGHGVIDCTRRSTTAYAVRRDAAVLPRALTDEDVDNATSGRVEVLQGLPRVHHVLRWHGGGREVIQDLSHAQSQSGHWSEGGGSVAKTVDQPVRPQCIRHGIG